MPEGDNLMKTFTGSKGSTFLLLPVLILLLSLVGSGQEYPIGDVKFEPPDPRPESVLRLRISLFPPEEGGKEISIRLITYTDRNNDWKLTGPKEIIKHPPIKLKDNQGKDEEPLENEILVSIYNILTDYPPQKYTVIITYGRDKKSASIIVPREEDDQTPRGRSLGILRILRIPYEIAQKLLKLQDELRRGARDEQGVYNYKGERSVCVYNVNEKKLDRVAHSTDALYLSPTWSSDSKKIALIVNQGGKWKIAWVGIQDKKLQVVTEGHDDNPFWAPDGKNIIFLRNDHLQVVNVESMRVKAIDGPPQVDQIIGVSTSARNVVQVIYEAPNPYTSETKEVYMLELDRQFKQKSRTILVNNPGWFLINAVSPSGDKIVYSQDNALLISSIDGKEKERLFEDNNKYYEAAWSPDGNKITFVSNSP